MNLVGRSDTAVNSTWNPSHYLNARTGFESGISGRGDQWLSCCSSRIEAYRTPLRFRLVFFLFRTRTSLGRASPEIQRTQIA
jgi:hypothetical protein